MSKVVIRTTQRDFEHMHEQIDNSRGRVTVTRATLLRLLVDYSTMIGSLEYDGHTVVDGQGEPPVPVRVRRRGG